MTWLRRLQACVNARKSNLLDHVNHFHRCFGVMIWQCRGIRSMRRQHFTITLLRKFMRHLRYTLNIQSIVLKRLSFTESALMHPIKRISKTVVEYEMNGVEFTM